VTQKQRGQERSVGIRETYLIRYGYISVPITMTEIVKILLVQAAVEGVLVVMRHPL